MAQHVEALSPESAFSEASEFALGFLPRGSIDAFVERHVYLWEGAMALLTLAYLIIAFWDEERSGHIPDWILLVMSGVFLTEFAVRLWNTKHRKGYIRQHWVDAVTAIPLLGPLRALRLLRLLRLAAVMRVLTMTDHVGGRGERGRASLWFLGPCLIAVWLGASYAFWVLEHGTNPEIRAFPDALYMTFVTATTFGYGSAHPITAGGQVLSGMLIFFGIGTVGFASSQITARLLHQEDTTSVISRDFAALQEEIRGLRQLIEESVQRPVQT
jgi:voltage-gated potassium channel